MADAPKPTTPLVWGCLTLFGLPFFAAGVLTMLPALRTHGDRHDWPRIGFAAVFVLVGLGLIAAGPIGLAIAKRRRAREAQAPDRPWLWRDDWASGRIRGAFGSGGGSAWVFVLGWLTIAVPIAYWILNDPRAPVLFQGIFGVGFPLIGIIGLAAAVRGTLRARRFGRSVLTLDSTPAPPGGALSGRVDCGVADQLDPTFEVVLQCMETWTEPGKGRSSSRTRMERRWRDDYVCAGERSADIADGSLIGVRFDLPADALHSGSSSRGTIVWTLTVTSTLPGIDYRDSFEVPVYPAPAGASLSAPRPRPAAPSESRLPTGRLSIADDGGETRVVYPPAMNPGFAMIPTGLLIVSGFMCWRWWQLHDWWGLVPGGAFAALMLWAATRAWLVSTVVTARAGEIEVERGLLGLALWRRTWRSGEAEDLELSNEMTVNGNPWHKLEVRAPGEKHGRTVGPLVESHGIAQHAKDALRRRFRGDDSA
jgi:hypothetical protein